MKTNPSPRSPAFTGIESLEARIAPATLVSPTTVTYSDHDGDDVTITISEPLFTAANLGAVLSFTNGAMRPDGSIPQALKNMNVLTFGSDAAGMDISIMAEPSAAHGGDGQADLYAIDAYNPGNANSVGLGKIRVNGDITRIDAGDNIPGTRAANSIDVDSWGVLQHGLDSILHGQVGSIRIRGEMLGSISMDEPGAKLGRLLVGGSVGDGSAPVETGHVAILGDLGKLRVAQDLQGGGPDSGAIQVNGKIGSAFIGGSIIGESHHSGMLTASEGLDRAVIKGDIIGGFGQSSGVVVTGGLAASLKVGGNVIGGSVASTGAISGEDFGRLSIGGDLVGGNGKSSGQVYAAGSLSKVKIGGSITGGAATQSGSVIVGNVLAKVIIGHDLTGKAYDSSGLIYGAEKIGDVTIGGSMSGATGATGGLLSGSIYTHYGSIGNVFVGGDFKQANIISGIFAGEDGQYGTGTGIAKDIDAAAGINKIASVIIGGTASAAAGHFGIEANKIGSVQVGAVTYAHGNPAISYAAGFDLDPAHRVTVREL